MELFTRVLKVFNYSLLPWAYFRSKLRLLPFSNTHMVILSRGFRANSWLSRNRMAILKMLNFKLLHLYLHLILCHTSSQFRRRFFLIPLFNLLFAFFALANRTRTHPQIRGIELWPWVAINHELVPWRVFQCHRLKLVVRVMHRGVLIVLRLQLEVHKA